VPCIQEQALLAEGQRGLGGKGRGLCVTTAERACPAAPPVHLGTTHMAPAPRMLLTSAPLQLAQRLLAFIDCQ